LASRFFPLLFILLFSGILSSGIQANSLLLEGESYQVDQATETYTYTNPRVQLDGATIMADRLVYNKKEGKLDFKGNILVRQLGVLLTAREAQYDSSTDKLILDEATLFDENQQIYAQAKQIKRIEPKKFVILDGTITTCNPEDPAWILEFSKVIYEIDNFAYALNSAIYLHKAPIFYTPFFSWPTKGGRATGFLVPRFETKTGSSDLSKNWGVRLQIPYFIEFGEEHDLTVTADLLSRRGGGLGLDYRYAFVPGMRGQLYFWHLDETVEDRNLVNENLGSESADNLDLRPTRFRYLFNHRQNIFWGGQLFYKQWANSDNELNKEYFDYTVNKDVAQAQNIGFVFPWDKGGVSITAQKQENFLETSIYDKSTDRKTHLNILPKVTLTHHLERIGGTAANLSTNHSLTRYRRIEGWDGTMGQSKVQLGYPLHLNFLNILPRYIHHTYYYDVVYQRNPNEAENPDFNENPASFGWAIGEKQLELNLELFKLYHNQANRAAKRLSFRPRLIYKEVDDIDQRRSLSLTPDQHELSYTDNDYSYSGHGGTFKPMFTKPLLAQRNFTLRLDSLFQTKNLESERVQDFLQVNLIQIFDLLQLENNRPSLGPQTKVEYLESKKGDPRLPLRLEIILSPTPSFSSTLFYRYVPQTRQVLETRWGVSNTSMEGERTALLYTYNTKQYHELDGANHNISKNLNLTNEFKLSNRLKLEMGGRWDLTRDKNSDDNNIKRLDRNLTKASLGLIFTTECYRVIFGYREKIRQQINEGVREEYLDQRISLSFNLTTWSEDSSKAGYQVFADM
jgi:lipopolysaccharide assembly outer membrane protein LptD (OstA)